MAQTQNERNQNIHIACYERLLAGVSPPYQEGKTGCRQGFEASQAGGAGRAQKHWRQSQEKTNDAKLVCRGRKGAPGRGQDQLGRPAAVIEVRRLGIAGLESRVVTALRAARAKRLRSQIAMVKMQRMP